jgi:pentose-5-phosphate-3-epimerase
MLVNLHGVKQLNKNDETVYYLKFVDGSDNTVAAVDTIELTGYEIAVAGSALADTDTLLEALGKLEARVDALENA